MPQICHADTGLFDLCIKVRPAGEDQHGDTEARPVQTAGQLDHLALGTAETEVFHDEEHMHFIRHGCILMYSGQICKSVAALPCARLGRIVLFMKNAHPHTSDIPLRVVVSLDVEEEGLFSGHYAASVQAIYHGVHHGGNGLRIAAKGPGTDDDMLRIGINIRHRGKV